MRFCLKRAAAIVGRFAFGGWLLASGIVLLIALFLGFTQRSSLEWAGVLLLLLLYGLLGFSGGVAVGIIAAVLDRLIKPPAGKAVPANEAADSDPSVWPPAPKPPQ